jgi:hypothetical protein
LAYLLWKKFDLRFKSISCNQKGGLFTLAR